MINLTNKVENYSKSLELKKQQLVSLEAAVGTAADLFQFVLVDYLEVLLVQRDLNEARLKLIETKQGQLSAIVNAYQALGGGLLRSGAFAGVRVPTIAPVEENPVILPSPEEN